MERPPTKHLSPRLHPRRLDDGAYRRLWAPVFFTLTTARKRAFLVSSGTPALVVEALDWNADPRGTHVIAYCVMPDHVHVIACNGREGEDLRHFAKGVKLTSSRLFREAFIEPPFWQRRYWDKHARACDDLGAQIEYVLMNPCRAGLCERPEDWPYSEHRGLPPGFDGC